MKVGDLVTWKYPMSRFAHMIGVVIGSYTDRNDRDRCDIMWSCDREKEEWIPMDILKAVK